jgi:hypothetical protein
MPQSSWLASNMHSSAPCASALQVFNTSVLFSKSNTIGGNVLRIRESSFLSNPRTLANGKLSRAVVVAGSPACGNDCVQESMTDGELQLVVPHSLTGEAVQKLLAKFAGKYRVLHFKNPHLVFKSFGDAAVQAEFAKLMSDMTVDWCCRTDRMIHVNHLAQGHRLVMRPFQSPTNLCAYEYDKKNTTYFCS